MGGRGGLLREYDWAGKMLWEHRHIGQHHDFRRLPNGNTMFLGWEVVPPEIANRITGNITLFANGINTTTNPFSRVIELDPRNP
jgi:hypothetical protein